MLHTLQLTYTLNPKGLIGLDEIRFFLRGNNLATISSIKDKIELNIGRALGTLPYSHMDTKIFLIKK